MQQYRKKQYSVVRRITIDEKLSSGVMRLLIAGLKSGVMAFDDSSKYWKEEKEHIVNLDNYQDEMGMTPDDAKEWPWDKLYEGQTFLQGQFRIESKEQAQPRFFVDWGKRNFECIDSIIKEQVKKEYQSALEGGI